MLQTAQDLISLPIEMNTGIADTKFRLVHIASQRVRQLSAGADPQVASRSIKDTTLALEEAVAKKLSILTGEEAVRAKEEFRKLEEQAKIDEQLSEKEEEIRKELSAYLSDAQSEEPVAEASSEEETTEDTDDDDREPADDDMDAMDAED